jgi:hypothetical protein
VAAKQTGLDMKSSAFATTDARPAAGRHAAPRQAQDWLIAGLHAHGRHAQGRPAADRQAPVRLAPERRVPGPQAPDGQVPGPQVPERHAGTRRAGALARRFAVSAGAAAMVAIGLPQVI